MGKRSDFPRVERDYYRTPYEAAVPLLPHLNPGSTYIEPCAGDGALIRHLAATATCVVACDIEPQAPDIRKADAMWTIFPKADYFITNPPWDRKILHPLIERLSDLAPTWLLFDADWMHTRQSIPFLPRLRAIVSVGRVKWIEGSKMTGKDNCAWYCFTRPSNAPTQFFGRQIDEPKTVWGGDTDPKPFSEEDF
jgi:hypothetical protein